MYNRARVYSAKLFFISLIIALTCYIVAAPPVHALPLTGNFEITFNQAIPNPVANAGHGTFSAAAGVVTAYEFEFTSPLVEDFEGPPSALAWNGTSLSGSDFAEYISGIFLQFLGANVYEISVPQIIYFDNYLGSICGADGIVGNCLSAIGTYTVNQVPEPTSLALLAIGLAVNGIRRRFKDSHNRRSRHQ